MFLSQPLDHHWFNLNPSLEQRIMATGRQHYSSLNSALRDTGRRSSSSLLSSTVVALRDAFRRRAPVKGAASVCTPAGFAVAGDRLLRESRRLRQPLSMAVFDFEELPDIREAVDRPTFQSLLAVVLARLGEVAGSRGVVGHTGPAEFSVLLPGCTRDQAHGVIAQVMGTPVRVEHHAGRRGDFLLLPNLEIEQAGADVERIMELHGELRYDLEEASSCQRQYLLRQAREREASASQPMRLDDTAPTIAAPLAPRAGDAAQASTQRSPVAAR